MGLKKDKVKKPKPSHQSSKSQKSLRILRTSDGMLKRNSKFNEVGFIRANLLTHSSTRQLQKLGSKRKGQRQKMRERVEMNKSKVALIKEKKRQNDEGDDNDVLTDVAQKSGYFDVVDELKISKEDEDILEKFFSQSKKAQHHKQLVEDIAATFDNQLKTQEDKGNSQINIRKLEFEKNYLQNPKVLLVYSDVADLLKTYRSGKLPQPFHVIPTVAHWEELMKLTKPEEWTPQALFAATKIFSSSMNTEKAEYFYKNIILPAVRLNIKENKKLNYHYYNALVKALYKPQAFMKGILFELCNQTDVTLKEAQIIGSIIHKHTIPAMHGAIVIYKLLQYPFTGPQALLLKLMLDKKYTLPQKVVSEMFNYFNSFINDERVLPVIWHQNLLRFCELYSSSFSESQKGQIKTLTIKKNHYLVSPEILKALSGVKEDPNKSRMDLEK